MSETFVVVYKHPGMETEFGEVFGPFVSEKAADGFVTICQDLKKWKGQFHITSLTNPEF